MANRKSVLRDNRDYSSVKSQQLRNFVLITSAAFAAIILSLFFIPPLTAQESTCDEE